MRALRPDKLTLTALCATLEMYRDERQLELPAHAMLSADADTLKGMAEALIDQVGTTRVLGLELRAIESAVGGGAMPTVSLPSWGVALSGASARNLESRLRLGDPAVIGRIHDDELLLDVRTLWNESQRSALALALVRLDEELARGDSHE